MCGHTPGKVAGRQETVKAEMNGLTPGFATARKRWKNKTQSVKVNSTPKRISFSVEFTRTTFFKILNIWAFLA